MRRIALLPAFIMVFAAGAFIGHESGQGDARASAADLLAPLHQVWELIDSEYVPPHGEQPAPEALVDAAIHGMVDALADEYSGYLDAQHYPLFQSESSGAVEGIGVVIRTRETDGNIEVANVLAGTPAEAAGIRIGDVFAEVDGTDVRQASQLELATLVRGPSGSRVSITMLRGGQPVSFQLTRARIAIPVVTWERLEDEGFGYILLREFSAPAREELDRALDSLETQPLAGLVLDFRGNPGGLLDAAIDIGSAFIERGTLAIEDFGTSERIIRADGSWRGPGPPLVVLMDERSASAAELVAGALQDHGRATIVGQPSFGKGTVQSLHGLENGGGLRLSIARWLTPDGHWIHGQGITPDILVAQPEVLTADAPDRQLEAALAHLREQITREDAAA